MKTSIKSLIAAALAGTALFTALPASAHDGDWDRGDSRHWRRDDHRGHGWGHHKHHWSPRYEERVVVRERPVYRSYYYEEPVRYYAPPPVRYGYADPSIIVGVSIPPLVIPLR
jgi:hypothetical protein